LSGLWQIRRLPAIIVIAVSFLATARGQDDVLLSKFSFRNGTIRTGDALEVISKRVGYFFTYDSKIIDTESKTSLEVRDVPLKEILESILDNDSLKYTVIGNHIIISRTSPEIEIHQLTAEPDKKIFISGEVVDNVTDDPLPFATIAIRNKPRGTVTNINGFFAMNITAEELQDTLLISYLGYLNRAIPIAQIIGNNFTFKLFRDYIPIPEIIIRTQVPSDIIKRAIREIPANYGTTPASMWAFYREGVLRGKEIQLYSEAVIQLFKSSYSNPRMKDQVSVVRSRKNENISSSDTVLLRLKAGLGSSLLLDGIKNTFEFMDQENFSSYRFWMSDIVTINESAAYVIEFEQMEYVKTPLFRGSMMINTKDFALMQTEFELNPKYINKSNVNFVISSNRGYTVNPVSIKYRVSYNKSGERYYLSHVRGDLRFSVRKKRRLSNSSYDIFFEMAVTSASTENVTRFERDETIPLESVFSRTINGYDPEYWGDFDFLRPEDDLINALSKATLKLSGYTKNRE